MNCKLFCNLALAENAAINHCWSLSVTEGLDAGSSLGLLRVSKAVSSKLPFPLPPHNSPAPSHHGPLLPDDQLHHIPPLSFAPCRGPMPLYPRRSLGCLLLLPLAWELSDLFKGPIFSPILQQYLGVVLLKQQHLRHGQDPLD